jgi:hypothetical protein
MKRDPFYRQIIEGLEGDLDPDLLEECVADLLRNMYPTLVPIHGGKDAGMDGAIADAKGEPFPLITTTSENAIRNLTKNLNSYLKDGRKRRRFIFATSRSLTSRKIRNLEERANELGFILIQTYHQRAIADLLYHSPEWCLELLGLTGRPPALSVIPKTRRPLLDEEIVGREADFAWLRQTQGDRLLVGQPGSGKTFLLYKFASEGGGLFVVDRDRGQIANGIRSEQPEVIMVDDAQDQLDLLLDLKQIRSDIRADFSILATSWPGDQEKIVSTLNLSQAQVHDLNLLSRDEIVQVIKAIGVQGPDELIREIVDQAEGRPGLAVTLANICLQGGVPEVVLGDALGNSVRDFFEPILGSGAIDILAGFSVGGDAGMSKEVIAKNLGLSLSDLREKVAKLAAGGIIWETNSQNISIYPESLRHALIRDVFFQNALSLSIGQFIEESPDLEQTARTLIGAYWRGARIPQDFLVGLLERANSAEAWRDYAWQGSAEATWVLDKHPELLAVVMSPALHLVPQKSIPMLLESAIGDDRLLHATTDHPLRQIQDWIRSGYPGTEQAVGRRRKLIQIAQEWLTEGKDTKVGFKALRIGFSPLYEGIGTDPGSGKSVYFRRGYLLPDEMKAIQELWLTALNIIRNVHQIEWGLLRELIRDWAFPGVSGVKVSDETRNMRRLIADRLLRDIVSLANERPGVLHWTQQIALDAGFHLDVPTDPEFEILYPIEDRKNFRDADLKHRPKVISLAEEWSEIDPEIVVNKIVKIEREAVSADLHWPRWTPLLCGELSNRSENPILWSRILIKAGLTGDLIKPFLEKAIEGGFQGWKQLLFEALERKDLRWMAVTITLTLASPPEDLLRQVFRRLSGYDEAIKTLCLRREVPEDSVRKLLRHEDSNLAGAAAYGEWYADPKGQVRSSLVDDWYDAIVRTRIDYFLSEVLRQNTELAFRWLLSLLGDENVYLHDFDRSIPVAVSALDLGSKKQVLDSLPEDFGYGELVIPLVGNDVNLYKYLLENERLQDLHLIPLVWHESDEWAKKAKLALDKGYSPEKVVDACYGYPIGTISWSGRESVERKKWVDRFSLLLANSDERIQEIGKIGKAHAELALQRALERERREEIYGLDRAWRNRRRLS